MSIIIVLISISFFVALLFLSAFIWAIKHGQFDDNYTPAIRILHDDNDHKPKKTEK